MKLAALSRHITPDTVHEARTAARRLRALLRAYKAELSPLQAHRYRRALKRVAKQLGRLRDADVAHQSVASLAEDGHRRHRDQLEGVTAALEHRRFTLALALQAHVAEPPWSDCVSRLRAAAGENLVLASERPIAVVTSKLLARRRRRLRGLLRKSQQTPRALHRLRLKVKNLRYLRKKAGASASPPTHRS